VPQMSQEKTWGLVVPRMIARMYGANAAKVRAIANTLKNFFVWHVSHDFIRLTLPLSGAPFRASA